MLNDLNNRREQRIMERNQPKLNVQRGRPVKSTNNNNKKYTNSFSEPFTKNQLKAFLACFFRASTLNTHDTSEYWAIGDNLNCGHVNWFNARMSKRQYEEIKFTNFIKIYCIINI